MTISDSMFLVEIIVEELRSYSEYCKKFYIRSQFADVFTLNLKDPNEDETVFPKRVKKKKFKKGIKVKRDKTVQKLKSETRVRRGQSILFTSSISSLISNMKMYPMELFLWSKDNPDDRIGSTTIPWSSLLIDYLNKLYRRREPTPVAISGEYNVFDDCTSKRMATIKLNVKLSCLKDKITTRFRSLSEKNQETFMYTGFDSKPAMIFSTLRNKPENSVEEIGKIKTIYSSGKGISKELYQVHPKSMKIMDKTEHATKKNDIEIFNKSDDTVNNSITNVTQIENNKQMNVVEANICSPTLHEQYNISDFIFGNGDTSCGNKVYCVNYFTIENDLNKSSPSKSSSKTSLKAQSSEKSTTESKGNYKLRICDSECANRKTNENACNVSICSFDLPKETANLIKITKCEQIDCSNKNYKEPASPPDDRILLDISNVKKECCDISEKVEQVVGEMKAKMKFKGDPCYCSCECTFGFTKKTTYCTVCGGYEKGGEPLEGQFPCPIFHKLVDKNKLKTWSTSGSDSNKTSLKRGAKGGTKSTVSEKRSGRKEKNVESEKSGKKVKKNDQNDDRFKFNYGYQAPQIGHSRCAFPCTGTMGTVPKKMGWLWTAENVPGLKFRPMWKPGATNKHVVRLLRNVRNPGQVIAKKKKKDAGKKKKVFKRPLLIVHKKDGEFTVTMETMKNYPKPRAINQLPFDDKPLLTYTVGRTEEENRERQRRKERQQKKFEREQRQFIQSAFKDVCREICMKTYEQALGLLPGAENPDCPCYSVHADGDKDNIDVSCSCSDVKSSIGSDTDSDEWIVEFTPPNAFYNPTFKGKKVVKTDNSSQYTYLDYRVKLLDRYGNPVPRFFKGPDGKQQCSDLGGFWSPEHKWLEINVDGYVASDERWAPNSFLGPNGEQVDTNTGKFQVSKGGKWLMVGIDGYVDAQGKWKFYSKRRGISPQKKSRVEVGKKGTADKIVKATYKPTSEATWSCFGDASPKRLSKMGIVGHGQDKKLLLSTLRDLMAQGEDVRLPQISAVPRYQQLRKKGKAGGGTPNVYDSHTYFSERSKCKHPTPSDKGIVAVDGRGNKTYFRMKDSVNKRPKQRLHDLKQHGISLSTFHAPCFRSFINSNLMKQEQMERLLELSAKNTQCVSTQIG